MLQSFIKAGKLRRWLSRPNCPVAIREIKRLFDRSYSSGGKDKTEINTYGNGDEVFVEDLYERNGVNIPHGSIPADLRSLVYGEGIRRHARIQHDGVVYSSSSTHLGNSLIYFYPCGKRHTSPVPGSIKYIFSRNDKVAYAVQRQLQSGGEVIDPFRSYPDFPAKIYSSTLSTDLELVDPEWVMSHYARWDYTPGHVVVVSLSKVSHMHICPPLHY